VDIVPDAIVNEGDMVGEVERRGGDEERDEDEEDQVENELLRRSQHVQGEGDLILVLLQLQPANERRNVRDPLLPGDFGIVGHFDKERRRHRHEATAGQRPAVLW